MQSYNNNIEKSMKYQHSGRGIGTSITLPGLEEVYFAEAIRYIGWVHRISGFEFHPVYVICYLRC